MHMTGMKLLTRAQMTAVALLAGSIFIVTSPAGDLSGTSGRDANPNILLGLVLSLVTCALSTAGGVYNEKLMKDQRSVTIHWQNIQVYTWGVMLNSLALAWQDHGRLTRGGFTEGYNAWTWGIVANNMLTGLCISAVLKVRAAPGRHKPRARSSWTQHEHWLTHLNPGARPAIPPRPPRPTAAHAHSSWTTLRACTRTALPCWPPSWWRYSCLRTHWSPSSWLPSGPSPGPATSTTCPTSSASRSHP